MLQYLGDTLLEVAKHGQSAQSIKAIILDYQYKLPYYYDYTMLHYYNSSRTFLTKNLLYYCILLYFGIKKGYKIIISIINFPIYNNNNYYNNKINVASTKDCD